VAFQLAFVHRRQQSRVTPHQLPAPGDTIRRAVPGDPELVADFGLRAPPPTPNLIEPRQELRFDRVGAGPHLPHRRQPMQRLRRGQHVDLAGTQRQRILGKPVHIARQRPAGPQLQRVQHLKRVAHTFDTNEHIPK
jgi:hypothetical protein